jgi:hypothetical protein
MKFKTIMMAAGAAVSLLAFEPATLLLKVAIGAAGAAVGAVLIDPVAAEAIQFSSATCLNFPPPCTAESSFSEEGKVIICN